MVEIVADHEGDTWRTVHTVGYAEAIYVLRAFQKKSKQGIATPKSDIDLIKRRLKIAGEDYKMRSSERRRNK